jgi:hypothetical protein
MTQKIVITLFLIISIFFTLMTIIDLCKHIKDYKVNGKQINEFEVNIEIIIVSVLWGAFYLLNQLPSF